MAAIIYLVVSLWYVWVLMIFLFIFRLFSPKIKGYLGEKSVSNKLSKLDPSKYKVINNLMLKVDSKTTQIDHIVVSNYGIFVIETKNYKGWIIGNENDEYWKQVIYKRKEKLYNPIKQNYGHIMALKEVLNDFHNLNYISIVTFTINADLKVNTKTDVTYTTKLIKTIERYKDNSISDNDKEEVYNKLLSLNVDNKDNRKTHVQAINDNIKVKGILMNNDICPKCGGNLVNRKGKYGEFKGCSNFPKCRFIVK
ncbi:MULTISPECIES: NERD domain-containing protein [unclassified Clostridium]|uniref:NERD domain-containing protein n=1 Tax=unclassified Clostridium TaxID=2614128 RepID=UPI0002974BB2|nr:MULTISPECIES: NERD domain-containing protein [unclassified Clostridium]EKQ58031.1 MAG: Zn-finger domain-containing protein (topoisomerase type I-like) [Clostridium sp. Maddingley MBC34-26]